MNSRAAPIGAEIAGIFVAVLFLALGFLAAFLSRRMQIDLGDPVLIFLLLIPLLIYMVWTGRLLAVKGPGGLEATFAAMERKPSGEMIRDIDLIVGTAEEITNSATVVQKSSLEELARLERRLEEAPPVVLQLPLGNHCLKEHLCIYLDRLSRYQTFQYVIFTDGKGRFLGYTHAWALMRILDGVAGDHFAEILNDGRVEALWDFPGVYRNRIAPTLGSLSALKILVDSDQSAAPVVDANDRFMGMLERERLLGRLMLAMANPQELEAA